MAVSGDAVAVLAAKFAVMRKVADERAWRVYLGSDGGGAGSWGDQDGGAGGGGIGDHGREGVGRSSPARSMTCRLAGPACWAGAGGGPGTRSPG